MKVLIVEDEFILRAAYKSVLTQAGFTVSEAADGKEALTRLAADPPDLILLDILMPVMDGISFLKQAKIRDRYPGTKVIAFSNLSDQQKVERMLRLGANRHVLKSSLSPRQLVVLVHDMLG